MKDKIDIDGHLVIKRGKKYKDQYCFYDNERTKEAVRCGDWCPQFGEPVPYPKAAGLPGRAYLTLCQDKVLKFDEFKDER